MPVCVHRFSTDILSAYFDLKAAVLVGNLCVSIFCWVLNMHAYLSNAELFQYLAGVEPFLN